jgi:hypothetical protein
MGSSRRRGLAVRQRRWATGVEAASVRHVHRAWRLTAQHHAGRRCVRVRYRNGREQGVRVVMQRVAEQILDRRDFDDGAEIHHRHAVGDETHRGQIVRDVEVGQPQRRAQLNQQVEDLRPHRDIERRDRLVQHQEARLHRQRARDADALALTAAEFVRIAPRMRRLQADTFQQRGDPVVPFRLRRMAMHAERFAQGLADGPARVEREIRVLKHVLHAAPHPQHGGTIVAAEHRQHILAVEPDLPRSRRHQMQHAARGGGLAAAAFADQRQGLAGATLEATRRPPR